MFPFLALNQWKWCANIKLNPSHWSYCLIGVWPHLTCHPRHTYTVRLPHLSVGWLSLPPPPPLTYDVIPSPTHMLFAPTPHLCEWCLSPGMNILHVWEGRTKSRPRPWHLSNEREFSTTQFGFGFSSACKMSNLFYFRFIFLCKIDKQIWEGISRSFNVDIDKGRLNFFFKYGKFHLGLAGWGLRGQFSTKK